MSANRPTAVTVATSTSRYDSPTHVTAPTDASNVLASVGSATVTMEASSWPMKAPTHTAATANHGAFGLVPDDLRASGLDQEPVPRPRPGSRCLRRHRPSHSTTSDDLMSRDDAPTSSS